VTDTSGTSDTSDSGEPRPSRDPVAWDVAERVAIRVAGHDPLEGSYLYDSLDPDLREFTAQAEVLVERETGLRSLAGPARVRVTDRPGWVRANVASFRRLLRPLTERLGQRLGAGTVASVGRSLAGAEVGALLGWMSTRVLGQYDLLVIESEDLDDQDIVYYVGPNILSLEKRYGFPPREFRLWLALHEVTHRAQFTGVPWMRQHFLTLVESSLAAFDPDPKRFVAALRRALDQIRAGQNPLDEGGLVTLFAGPEQHAILQRIQGLMSLLEGHGDLTMDRAGADLIPSAGRFRQVLHQRRQSSGPARLVQKLVGMEAKLRQYQEGEEFLETVERANPGVFDLIWRGPEWLPSLDEIRHPDRWLARVAAAEAAGAAVS
jgi:coenzyme F420 biosynthesis associated uncharacterized protein